MPHEILLAIAQGDDTILGSTPTPEQRIDCAKAAAPYYAPRMATAEVKHSGENPMAELMARIGKGPSGLPYKRTARGTTLLRPEFQAAATIRTCYQELIGDGDSMFQVFEELVRQGEAVEAGDMKRAERMLTAQAHTLDAIFNRLATMAVSSDCLPKCDLLLRLALRAQGQCRATIETLATIKNPPPTLFVRQQNVGVNQQVNNGVESPSPTRETGIEQSKLLVGQHGERLDGRTAGTPIGVDQELAAVGAINRPEDAKREGGC